MEELYLEAERTLSDTSILLPEEIEIPTGEDISTISKARKGQAFSETLYSQRITTHVVLLELPFHNCCKQAISNHGKIVIH